MLFRSIIEEDVWIDGNVTIMPGVRVGRGSTVSAGTVVHKVITNPPPFVPCHALLTCLLQDVPNFTVWGLLRETYGVIHGVGAQRNC